jgi:tight adherence protein B
VPALAPGADRAAVLAAAALSRATGVPLADVLERVGEFARDRHDAEAARESALAGPRASAAALQLMPVAGVVQAVAVEPGSLAVLVTTPFGWAVAAGGLGLAALGRRWMRALARRAAQEGRGHDDALLALALVEAAVVAGQDVRGALAAVSLAAHGPVAVSLGTAAKRLGEGWPWERAWRGLEGCSDVERALRFAWSRGSSPVPTLRAVARGLEQSSRSAAERAAAELGVRVTLPLAVCFLPAFVLVAVVPLLVALARGLDVAG